MSILLIAAEQAAAPIAESLRRDLNSVVEIAETRRSAHALLRRHEFNLLILDQSFVFSEADAADMLFEAASSASLLELNFALCSADRVVRQARAAISRRTRDVERARIAAAAALRSELNASLAGLLLQSELVLRDAPPESTPQLKYLVEIAVKMRDLLKA